MTTLWGHAYEPVFVTLNPTPEEDSRVRIIISMISLKLDFTVQNFETWYEAF